VVVATSTVVLKSTFLGEGGTFLVSWTFRPEQDPLYEIQNLLLFASRRGYLLEDAVGKSH
jgi:hypothetical protein